MTHTGSARAEKLKLDQLIKLVRQHNAGIAASEQAGKAIEARLKEAKRSWMPSGQFLSMVAPVPEVRCVPPVGLLPPVFPNSKAAQLWREENCSGTNVREANVNFSGVFLRTQLDLVQPIYTFGKISTGIDAAEAGIAAAQSQTRALAGTLDFNVTRAYYGTKLARAMAETLKEGLGYVEDAQKRIQKSLDAGDGTMTTTDKLRVETVHVEVESRVLEAEKGIQIAGHGIKALLGPTGPPDVEVDDGEREPVVTDDRSETHYQEQALLSRPEVRGLDYFVLAKRKLAEFEWRKQLPDLVLVGTATFAFASSIDDPKNAFANDPFNRVAAGLAAALRLPLDFGVRNAAADRLEAEAEQAAFQRREALSGIRFEVGRAFSEYTETKKRVAILERGERVSRRWLTSMIQKMEVGLAEVKELTDALQGWFGMRMRHLQAVYDHNIAVADLTRATGLRVQD